MRFRSFFQLPRAKQTAQPQDGSIHRTVGCTQFGHPEFEIRVSDNAIPAQDIGWLLRFFEQQVADGERFRSGETLQIGWMLTTLQRGDTDSLRVMEPDMKSMPARYIDSVDRTLRHLRNQKDLVGSLPPAWQPDFPSLRQSAVVHVGYRSANRLLLSRDAACDTDSGWSVTDRDDKAGSQDPARFLKISLYQLGVDRPDLVKFFALPPGLLVALDGPRIRVVGPEGEFQPPPGSYLEALNMQRL